jgi:hypothetical protein
MPFFNLSQDCLQIIRNRLPAFACVPNFDGFHGYRIGKIRLARRAVDLMRGVLWHAQGKQNSSSDETRFSCQIGLFQSRPSVLFLTTTPFTIAAQEPFLWMVWSVTRKVCLECKGWLSILPDDLGIHSNVTLRQFWFTLVTVARRDSLSWT